MKSICVLGIGSPFGDDQLGWKAIDLLSEQKEIQIQLHKGLRLEKCDRPGLNLLTRMHGATTVFLIDAIKLGNAIGTLYRWQNLEIEKLNYPISSHQIGIGQALQLGRILNQIPENIILYGIEIAEVKLTFQTSLQMIQSLKMLVPQIIEELLHRE